jgi:hypothetical protein
MTQYFLEGDDGESLDSVIADAMTQVLDEARRVVDGAANPRRDAPSSSGLACHPALSVDWSEGDAGFSDWLSNRPPSGNDFAA